MKKAIAALLASFVGLFGYQIVDKAIEERVNNLEYQVSSQQEEIESLHHMGEYSITTVNFGDLINQLIPTTTTFNIGDTQAYTGQTKFLFRLYTSGDLVYISPNNSNSINEVKVNPTETSQQVGPIFVPTTVRTTIIVAPTTTGLNSSRSPEYTNDYFLYITDASRTIVDIEDIITKIYDENYSTQTQVFGKEYTVRYNLKGKTDKALAGKEIVFRTQEYAGIRITINEDGTFEFSGDVIQNGLNNSFYFDYPIHVDR